MAEKRKPRKKGQHTGSPNHSDLYTNEREEGTIRGLGFKDAATARKGVATVNKAKRTHAHKVQATLVMKQRAKVAKERTKDPEKKKNLNAAYKIWSDHLEKLKKKTAKKNESLVRRYVKSMLEFSIKANKKNTHQDGTSKSRGYMNGIDKTWTGEDANEELHGWYKSMGLMKECIRELLKEKGELGKQVFAQSAPEGSRHAGDEPDTELETSLKRAIANHLFSGGVSSKELGELGPYILRFMDDPDYNDVFIRYPAGEVCRGTRMSLEEARSLIPGFDDLPLETATGRTHAFQKFEAMTQKVSIPPFEYSPKSGNQVSSWSTDSDRVCTRFAKKNADLWGGNTGVILYAEASQNDFLDFSELYKYGKLSKHSHEREVAAFGPVTVTAVKAYKEVTEEQWAEVQTEIDLGRPK